MTKLLLLFLVRNKIKYEIFMLIFIGIYLSYQQPSVYGTTLVFTLLIVLYILYFNFLSRQKNRINFLYSGSNIKKLRIDIITSLVLLSLVFLAISIIIDIFIFKSVYLVWHYFMSILIFFISTYAVPINIEKRASHDAKIVSFKDGTKIISLCLILYVLVNLLIFFI